MKETSKKNSQDKLPEFDLDAVFEPGDYLYFYKDKLSDKRTETEIKFLIKELALDRTVKILDLACGHGRHANRLAQLNHDITGIDQSAGFLEIAKKQAKEKGLNVKYIQQDMRQIDFKNEFDRVLLLFTSFGYFEDDENFLVLQNIAKALKPGGLFCFDILNKEKLLRDLLPYFVTERGADLMIDRQTFDDTTKRFYNKRIIIRNGKRKDKPYFTRVYELAEIRELLTKAGLEICKTYGNWKSEPLTNDSTHIIIIAQKKIEK